MPAGRPVRGSLPHRFLGDGCFGCRAPRGVERRLGRRRIDAATGRPAVSTGEARSVKRARYALWKNPET
jgi:hypothetical protein